MNSLDEIHWRRIEYKFTEELDNDFPGMSDLSIKLLNTNVDENGEEIIEEMANLFGYYLDLERHTGELSDLFDHDGTLADLIGLFELNTMTPAAELLDLFSDHPFDLVDSEIMIFITGFSINDALRGMNIERLLIDKCEERFANKPGLLVIDPGDGDFNPTGDTDFPKIYRRKSQLFTPAQLAQFELSFGLKFLKGEESPTASRNNYLVRVLRNPYLS